MNGLEMFGFRLASTPCLPLFVRWRRTNRNDRIARKWRKRYGAVTKCGNTHVFRMGGTIYACQCIAVAIREKAHMSKPACEATRCDAV